MKSQKITEGKTKIVWSVVDYPDRVVIESKNDITAFDDPTKTKQFGTKAEYATNTTCRVFELLKAAGIPVAYNQQLSPTEFLAPKCQMIPLEVIARRYAVGSYLKRYPNLVQPNTPHRFHNLEVEFFLKTTHGKLILNKATLVEGLQVDKGEEDPFINNPQDKVWNLYHSKKPAWDPEADLGLYVHRHEVLMSDTSFEDADEIAYLTLRTFLILESAWAQQNMRLIDFKIEFGRTTEGELMVADVIDNDSWRLRNHDWQDVSKESFRQGEALTEVEKKYGLVSQMVNNFRIPKQCLVLWRGSPSDEFPIMASKIPEYITENLHIHEVTLSGHKSPQSCLEELEKILAQYPDGGVILVKVGRSNGLGPILAARTSWPVIAIPATLKEYPEDLWSSIRLPSSVPLLVTWPEDNAVLAALNVLAGKNPAIYAFCQFSIENMRP